MNAIIHESIIMCVQKPILICWRKVVANIAGTKLLQRFLSKMKIFEESVNALLCKEFQKLAALQNITHSDALCAVYGDLSLETLQSEVQVQTWKIENRDLKEANYLKNADAILCHNCILQSNQFAVFNDRCAQLVVLRNCSGDLDDIQQNLQHNGFFCTDFSGCNTIVAIFCARLWLYWEDVDIGVARPPYLDLCLQTVIKNKGCFAVHDIGAQELKTLLPKDGVLHDKATKTMQMAQKVDMIRVALVREYGGFWLDADMVLVRPLGGLLPALISNDFVAIKQKDNVPNHFFGAKPHSLFMQTLWSNVENAFLEGKHCNRWTALGRDITTPMCFSNEEKYRVHYLCEELTTPILHQNHSVFLCRDKEKTDPLLKKWFDSASQQLFIMLYNNFMKHTLRECSEEEIMADTHLLSDIFRQVLGSERNEKPNEEHFCPFETNYYSAQKWIAHKKTQKNESLSGPGSFIVHTKDVVQFINKTLIDRNIATVLDLGCGDWNWFRLVNLENSVHYIGFDVDADMLQKNRQKYGRKNVKFEQRDIVTTDYPTVDLIVCRDVLFHLKIEFALRVLEQCRKKAQYLLTTSFLDTKQNTDIKSYNQIDGWGYYPINVDIEPFNLLSCKIDQVHESSQKRYVCLYKFF